MQPVTPSPTDRSIPSQALKLVTGYEAGAAARMEAA